MAKRMQYLGKMRAPSVRFCGVNSTMEFFEKTLLLQLNNQRWSLQVVPMLAVAFVAYQAEITSLGRTKAVSHFLLEP